MKNGRIVSNRARIRHDREHQFTGARELAVDFGRGTDPPDVLAHAHDRRFHHEAITRNDGTAKLHFIDARKVGHFQMKLARLQYDGARKLGERFDHIDAGKKRISRKMATEDRLVVRDVLVTDSPLHGLELKDTIDQQNWVAVRQHLHDLPNVELGQTLLDLH